MGMVGLAGAVADPQHMCRHVVPVAGRAVDPGQRFLVRQQQRFMAGEEVGLAQLRRGFAGDAAGRHEVQRLVKPVGEVAVALARRAALDEAGFHWWTLCRSA